MSEKSITFEMAGNRSITLSTGKLAKLANGSCTVRAGDTIVFTAACSGSARENTDFFPLQVDYREKYSAAGKFPGGYIKREGRPSDKEILVCRMADRPIRPLFPKGFFNEVQVQSLLLSADRINEPDVLSILGASVALTLSDLPFAGPIGALRVGMVDGEFIANPTTEEMEKSTLELIYVGLADKIIMIEGDAKELDEETMKKAFVFANEQVKIQIQAQLDLAKEAGKEKANYDLVLVPEEMEKAVNSFCKGKLDEACFISGKEERNNALKGVYTELSETLSTEFVEKLGENDFKFKLNMAFDEIVQKTVRLAILNENKRADGRKTDELRPLSAEVSVLPRTHGTGLFARGETQGLIVTTLGSSKDAQIHDSITSNKDHIEKKFYLHYNFPNYSVGETGRIMGPGRREIGHGNLAERSLAQIVPADYPYTIRCVSEIMGSNGSTSMASICGGSLSLMDAGVPIKEHVAGISCGLVKEGEKTVLLTDILGSEDHFGDMDFKVAGTSKGITGFQLDLKISGVSIDLMCDAMQRNKDARAQILNVMNECISEPREEMSPYAPRIKVVKINSEKIGALIGPGGKVIKGICEATGANIDIEDDGSVTIFASDKKAMDAATEEVQKVTAEAEIGKIYRGVVKSVKDFGCFVEFLPGQEGLVHISELADYRVDKVTDICKEGDKMSVKIVDKDKRGKIRLSRKAALAELE
ncbi:MAG TPA: polyribonucleotide nucleotidyltransferase [Victivallales bacterium]|nr:polyribonucleotide nucleotidyltransferase [Victivallales bacterium]